MTIHNQRIFSGLKMFVRTVLCLVQAKSSASRIIRLKQMQICLRVVYKGILRVEDDA